MSHRVTLSDLADRRVILRRAPFASLPICRANQLCSHNQTYESTLCFPQVAGIEVGPVKPAIDSFGRAFLSDGQKAHVEPAYPGKPNFPTAPHFCVPTKF